MARFMVSSRSPGEQYKTSSHLTKEDAVNVFQNLVTKAVIGPGKFLDKLLENKALISDGTQISWHEVKISTPKK